MQKTPLIDVDLAKSTSDNIQPLIKPGFHQPLGDDWLRGLEVGTCFISELKTQKAQISKYILDEFYVLTHTAKSTWLLYVNANQRLRVNSLRFSRTNDLVEVLGIVTPPTQEEQDEQHNRTDQPE